MNESDYAVIVAPIDSPHPAAQENGTKKRRREEAPTTNYHKRAKSIAVDTNHHEEETAEEEDVDGDIDGLASLMESELDAQES